MRRAIKLLLWFGVFVVLVYVVGRLFFFDVYELGYNDMAPTLVAGDQVLVYRHGTPDLGDIVVCDDPQDATRRVVGRVVGLPGSTVAIERGLLKINNVVARTEGAEQGRFRLIDVPNHGYEYNLARTRELLGNNPHDIVTMPNRSIELRPRRVQQGLFLLSDSRTLGRDSRHYGEVAAASCKGEVFFLVSAAAGTGDASNASRSLSWVR